jgi:hypothetical protein
MYVGPRTGSDGAIETILNPMVEASSVEVLPRFEKGREVHDVIRRKVCVAT